MDFLLILIGLVVVVGLALIAIYNGLVNKRQRCNQAFADVDVQLKQRRDLVPNLVEAVRGYVGHERETLEKVIEARNTAQRAGTVEEKAQAEGLLGGAIRGLLALAEAYPDLKASQNFDTLKKELSRIEDKLAAARRFYNSAVADFNTAVQQVPANLFAKGWGFTERTFFDLGEETRAELEIAPEVKF